MSKLTKYLDNFYFVYFLIHIPITVLIDSTLVIPKPYQFDIQKTILEFHLATNKDFLLVDLPLWLQIFGAVELLFQLPLFVIGSYCIYQGCKKIYPWMLLYGFNASFTTLVCIVYVLLDTEHGLTSEETSALIGVYVPTLLIPLIMMIDYFVRITCLISVAEINMDKKTI